MFKHSRYLIMQGGLVGTMTGNCLFYDIVGMHFFKLKQNILVIFQKASPLGI